MDAVRHLLDELHARGKSNGHVLFLHALVRETNRTQV